LLTGREQRDTSTPKRPPLHKRQPLAHANLAYLLTVRHLG